MKVDILYKILILFFFILLFFIFKDIAYHSQLTSWILGSKHSVFHPHPWKTTYMLFTLLPLPFTLCYFIIIYLFLPIFVILLSSVSWTPGDFCSPPILAISPSFAGSRIFYVSTLIFFTCIYNWCVCVYVSVCLPACLSVNVYDMCMCTYVHMYVEAWLMQGVFLHHSPSCL